MFRKNIQEKEDRFVCSRIQNYVEGIPPFLKELFERESQELEEKQRELFAQFLNEFQDVFSEEILAGNCKVMEHRINVENSSPIKQVPRRIPLQMREEVNKIMKT